MSVDVFQVILWGSTGLLIAALLLVWWRRDVRERREADLVRRWRNAAIWNSDRSARVVRVSRLEAGVAWLGGGEDDVELELALPDGMPANLDVGWYLLVAGWVPASRAVAKGKAATLGTENVKDVFPPDTPALNDKLMGRGDRKPGLVSRLLGLRGL